MSVGCDGAMGGLSRVTTAARRRTPLCVAGIIHGAERVRETRFRSKRAVLSEEGANARARKGETNMHAASSSGTAKTVAR